MRAPVRFHGWCRSVLLLAVVALLLMSSGLARAAGEIGDEGFIQAVIDGRRDAREAYERADQIDRVNVVEESRRREREASDRGANLDGSPSGRPGAAVSPEDAPADGGFPWGYGLLLAASVGAFLLLRRRR